MTFARLLAHAIRLLDETAIPYMVTGSVASSYHGEPRSTLDLDIVIDPEPSALEDLVDRLKAESFYVDRDAARSALATRTQFNAIGADAMKIDFIVRKDRPFSRVEFGRRRSVELAGTVGFITSVEDLVIAKLESATMTDSERQVRDVSGMLAVAGDAIDRDYLTHWVGALGLQAAWARLDPSG